MSSLQVPAKLLQDVVMIERLYHQGVDAVVEWFKQSAILEAIELAGTSGKLYSPPAFLSKRITLLYLCVQVNIFDAEFSKKIEHVCDALRDWQMDIEEIAGCSDE